VETRNEQAVFRDRAETAMAGRIPLDQAIEINIAFYMPIPQSWSRKKQAAALADLVRPITKPDFDNCSKMIDALKGIVWRDDCRVTDAHIYKRYSDRPRLVIEIRGIGPP
jgi:Holliday junction resolvase RusA-like endonuclease